MKLLAAILAVTLTGCAGVTPPPGQEDKKSFTQEIDRPYIEVYRKVVRQMTECYAITGMLGNGYKVIPELDTVAKQANVEVSIKGWVGDSSPESDSAYRLVTITAINDSKTKVTTEATKPSFAYGTHLIIPKWMTGYQNCS